LAGDYSSVRGSNKFTPTSLAGLKRSAKALKRESGIQYVKVLDAVAQLVGFSNYKHALNKKPIRFLSEISI